MADNFQAQYLAAAQAFTLPGTLSLSQMDLLAADPIADLLPKLEGDWVPANGLYPDPNEEREGFLASNCERLAVTLTQTDPHGFEIRDSRQLEGETLTMAVRYDFLFGNSFDRSVREEEAVAFMELDESEVSVGQLNLAKLRGQVLLFHPSPDILVLATPQWPTEIYGRCPRVE
ncbi:hypothetical protein Rumeso_02078 [Rubellimicrobium mesophilum DSM 19309]|uniref:Uncharacterized protein n=1 Tax=Rubellimicrobium mesophilum DSM 19309 TaxID=442562 RepID=A0A017HPS2_9RHOB|nr:hypothetical protein Rumeso_02078 [Rubellimicrobium mesophilum DSM 19309]